MHQGWVWDTQEYKALFDTSWNTSFVWEFVKWVDEWYGYMFSYFLLFSLE